MNRELFKVSRIQVRVDSQVRSLEGEDENEIYDLVAFGHPNLPMRRLTSVEQIFRGQLAWQVVQRYRRRPKKELPQGFIQVTTNF